MFWWEALLGVGDGIVARCTRPYTTRFGPHVWRFCTYTMTDMN